MSNNKFKVLIVEDEANICSFIETLLYDHPEAVRSVFRNIIIFDIASVK